MPNPIAQLTTRASAVALLAALAGCPGKSDARPDGGYDPVLGNPYDQPLYLSDQRVLELDPSTLPATASPCQPPQLVVVTHVTDGDTVDAVRVSDGARVTVRMIGVNSPEIAHMPGEVDQCFGPEATGFSELLLGRYVWLTYDAGCLDTFDRDLAYVWIGAGEGDMWNRQLMRRGFARTITVPPNETFAATFEADRADAEARGVGLWGACM